MRRMEKTGRADTRTGTMCKQGHVKSENGLVTHTPSHHAVYHHPSLFTTPRVLVFDARTRYHSPLSHHPPSTTTPRVTTRRCLTMPSTTTSRVTHLPVSPRHTTTTPLRTKHENGRLNGRLTPPTPRVTTRRRPTTSRVTHRPRLTRLHHHHAVSH
jgi:hypothetical protein